MSDVLRIYDAAIVDWVKKTVQPVVPGIDMGKYVQMATPERPFGFDMDSAPTGQSPDAPAEPTPHDSPERLRTDTVRASRTLSTPRIAVTRMTMGFDNERFNSNEMRNLGVADPDHNYVLQAPYPVSFHLPYQIDMHARYRNDANRLISPFMFLFPLATLQVPFPPPWGTIPISVMLGGIVDNSDLEMGERLRWYRHTLSLDVEAWMFATLPDAADASTDPCGLPQPPPTSGTGLRRAWTAKRIVVEIDP